MRISLSIRNWRSIESAAIEIAPFTVVVGANSSGKSNVVDALVFASEVARDADAAVSTRGGMASVRRWAPNGRGDVTIEVKATSTDGLTLGRHFLSLKAARGGSWRFAREEVELVHEGEELAKVVRDEHTAVGLFQDLRMDLGRGGDVSVLVFARQLIGPLEASGVGPPLRVRPCRPVPEVIRPPQLATEDRQLHPSGSNLTSAFRRLSAPEKAEVVAAMRRIIPGLTTIAVKPAGRYLTLAFRQTHSTGRSPEFTASEMSDGALRALAILVAAAQMEDDELLVVEEPEVSLHPGAAGVLYDALHRASERGAVLLTTHSPELLDHARDEEILVCDYEDGVTRVGPLASGQREILREGLYSAAELMRAEDLRREGAAPRVVRDE